MLRKVTWLLLSAFPLSLLIWFAVTRFQPPHPMVVEHGRLVVDHWPTKPEIIAMFILFLGGAAFIFGITIVICSFINSRRATTRDI